MVRAIFAPLQGLVDEGSVKGAHNWADDVTMVTALLASMLTADGFLEVQVALPELKSVEMNRLLLFIKLYLDNFETCKCAELNLLYLFFAFKTFLLFQD